MSDLMVLVSFTRNAGDDPALGLALADIDLYLTAIHKETGVRTVIWNGTQHPAFEVNNVGIYGRIYATADLNTYNYAAGGQYTGAVVLDNDYVAGSVGVDAETIWSYSPRTLTTAAAAICAAVEGSNISIHRGDSVSISIADLGDISAHTKLWFSVKRDRRDTDLQAIIFIEETDGLTRLNGASYGTPAHGSITVTDAVAGDITIVIDEAATALLKPSANVYDVQVYDDTDVTTLADARCDINADVTRATS